MDDAGRREWREKMRSIGVLSRRTGDQVREYRRGDGVRVKETTDEAGNLTRLHNTGDTERQDVELRPKAVTMADGRVLTHKESR